MSFLSGFNICKPKDEFIKAGIDVNIDFNIHKMKPNQKIVYSYINERWFILSEPPGAGKSTSIKFVVNKLLRKNPKLKVIIAVPQTLISKSFGSITLEYPDGERVEWDISNNLCEKIGTFDKIGELNNFIKRKEFGNNPADRIAMVTHITLSKLNTEGEDFNDVMFIIDEGHHVLYPENGGTESANKIGVLVHYMMNQEESNVKIWFVTATFYRGDKSNIIPPEELEKFITYHLPLDEYWSKYIKHIQSFSYDFVMYKNRDVFSEIKEIFKQKGKRKTIIFCPYIGYLVNDMNKLQFRDKVIEAIREVWVDCKFLDLIEIEDRYDKKMIVINNSEDFDVVLSVKLFDEGTDWVKAESIIDLCPSNSLRIQVQRFGRLLRDIYGKSHIDYNVFLPYESKFKDDEERRLHMSRSFNAFTASCLLHEAIEPVMKPVVNNNVEPKTQPLVDLGINDSKKQDLFAIVIKDLMFLKNLVDTPSISETKECIINSIKDFGIEDNIEEIVEYVVKTLRRSSIPMKNKWDSSIVDISWMVEKGFDKVWDNSLYDSLLSFTTGICGVDTFSEFRNIYTKTKKILEAIKIAEKLAKENGGKLPPSIWLQKHGYNWVYSQLKKSPDLFSHIEREMLSMSNSECVLLAKKLTKNNGGKLPTYVWLKKNGYGNIINCLNSYPELFLNIKREYVKKGSLNKAIKTAEKLTQDNDGKLPSYKWLINNDYKWLTFFICRYKEIFSKYNQESIYGQVDNRVIIAEKLAKNNGGKLPTATWLLSNGYDDVYHNMITYKKKFAHIKRETIRRPLNKTIKTAEKLAKDNGGKLPPTTWLAKNGYKWVVNQISDNKNSFSHIKKEKLTRSLDEAIKTAEKLAKDNGGRLPSTTWLRKDFGWLLNQIYSKPDKFSHIERGKVFESVDEIVKLAEKLAKNNGGKIPSYKWLLDNGYRRIINCRGNKPSLFSHIKKETESKSLKITIKDTQTLISENHGILPSYSWLRKHNYHYIVHQLKINPDSFKGVVQEFRGSFKTY